MDIKQVRDIFGSMPIEFLPVAQLMQQKRNRNKWIVVAVILSSAVSGCVVYYYMSKRIEESYKP